MGIATHALFLVAVLSAFAATFARDRVRAGLATMGSLLAIAAALAVLEAPIAALGVALLALGPVAAPILATPRTREDRPTASRDGRARRARRLEMAAAGAWIVAVAVAIGVSLPSTAPSPAPSETPGPPAEGEPGVGPAARRPEDTAGGGESAAARALFGKDLLAVAGAAGLAAMAVVAARPRKEAS